MSQGAATRNGSRLPSSTAAGRLIKMTSIDELPQLINILKGEMSLVGPRPPIPDEVALCGPWQRRRLSLKSGLTCIWQIKARKNTALTPE